MEMTEGRAREILGDAIKSDGGLRLDFKGINTPAVEYCPHVHGDYVWLRRGCSADELEAIAFWMRRNAP